MYILHFGQIHFVIWIEIQLNEAKLVDDLDGQSDGRAS